LYIARNIDNILTFQKTIRQFKGFKYDHVIDDDDDDDDDIN